MQEDPNTDRTDNFTEDILMDSEDWEAAFEPYEGDALSALSLGFKLATLRAYLNAQTIKCRHAIKALDVALEALFPFTSFHAASFALFIRLTEGKMEFEEEQMLKALGIKF